MRAGRLRHRVEIQTVTETADRLGQLRPSWSTTSTRRADVRPLAGREAIAAKQIRPEVTHAVTLRYRADQAVTTSQRLVFRGAILNITEVLSVDSRNRELALLCTEIPGDDGEEEA